MKTQKSNIVIVAVLLLFACLSACDSAYTRQYRGISVDDENGTQGLRNPERGLRLEVATNVESWDKVRNPDVVPSITGRLEQEMQKFASDSIVLIQTYFYLTETIGKPLTEKHFTTMQTFLDKLRELGLKAVLRFAYERQNLYREKEGPTMEDFRVHMAQLKPFLEKNKDVIYVMQAGFIGAWGEWHHSIHRHEKSEESKREILSMILDMVPKERMVQVRIPAYKNVLGRDHKDFNRVSFHDDFIVIKPHIWDARMSEGKKDYEQMKEESPYLVIDGELPWGEWSMNRDMDDPDGGWLIDGLPAARRLFLQHYSSLSAMHNYKENKGRSSEDEKFSMILWKETPIPVDFLKAEKMPISDGYFQKKDGTPVERNVFDYVRDHLGYRIELQELSTSKNWKAGVANEVNLSLINRGFSTLYNEHPVYFVLLDQSGNVAFSEQTTVNVNDWQPYDPKDATCTPLLHTISARIQLPEGFAKGQYQLALWIPDGSDRLMYDPKFAIRCANGDVPWQLSADGKYGLNILGDVKCN
ncbi:DUF4832 domain-containing protein [Parabacteroides sp. OttesenSCG-928-K15]|nr:DUF4832 domain-containing protein [Parabacteroides sp. OttesenSCG-928-K15]